MIEIRENFYKNLKLRNENQRRAIESIDGPLMVIAGPGTGKTDVLGLRIGYILEKTDTEIQNILCLTYTEAGAIEMRKRLIEYVGPTAYNAQVYTFHGFCNMVIHDNIEMFGVFREHQPVSELEQFQILKDIIDEQPMGHPLKRYSGQIYYETRGLKGLYDTMKLEQWSPEYMHQAIDEWVTQMQDDERFKYKRRSTRKGVTYEKGDIKQRDFQKYVIGPMEKLRAGVDTFKRYNDLLKEKGRYDYHDMLTWVHDQFRDNDSLLARYQERYQYFLVDEFQDSNGIQMALLNLLLSQWGERSDVFIVGDDDQSIFRFQGAMMQNILQFKKMYSPEVVVLTDNYRSTQNILDAASSVIECNNERLVVQFPEYTKNLRARSAHAGSDVVPDIRIYPNITQESAALLRELTDMHESGALEKESVAVIYRRHSQVEDIVHALEIREVPINVKRPVNILERPIIRNVLTILRYISLEAQEYGSGEHLIYELLQYRFFGINLRDAGVLAVNCRRLRQSPRTTWREVMGDRALLTNIGIKDVEAILAFEALFDSWISRIEHLTLQELVEKVLTGGGILTHIFSEPNRTWHLQMIKTFFDYAKDQSKRAPDIGLKGFLEDIELMGEHGIELPVNKILTAQHGIYFVTAHSAKGMQFDRVFMIGCTSNIWDKGGGGSGEFKLPENLSPISASGSDEDERRLFYVGMTRARKNLIMSYSLLNDNEREQQSSRFIQETLDGGLVKARNVRLDDIDFAHYCMDLMRPLELTTPLIDAGLLDQVLDNFVMSVSALNLYLECPRKFYFEYVLRIPSARKSYFGFGKAIHSAIEQFFTWHVADHKISGSVEDLRAYYAKYLKQNRAHFTQQEFALHMHLGDEILQTYYAQRSEDWKLPLRSALEYKINDAQHRGVPIKGVLDRLDFFRDMVVVTDYKTGKASNATSKLRPPKKEGDVGGNYWRQIVFYKLLIDASTEINKPMPLGYTDFVRPSSDGVHALHKIVVTPEDEDVVSNQIVDTYASIKRHEFSEGCGECYWCNLVRNEMHVDQNAALPEETEFEN